MVFSKLSLDFPVGSGDRGCSGRSIAGLTGVFYSYYSLTEGENREKTIVTN